MASEAAIRKQQALQTQYQTHKQTLHTLATRIGSTEQDLEEHRLVLSLLSTLPGERKCFRLVNGVLIQSEVGTVKGVLEGVEEGLKGVVGELVAEYRRKEGEMEEWRRREGVRVVR